MKKQLLIFIVGFLIFGCQKPNPKEQLQHLNGYWEIDRVEFSEDSVKDYSMSPYVDYIHLEDEKGFRKKVQPHFDGTFTVINNNEKVEATIENDSLRLLYKTPYATWEETVLSAEEDKLSIINADGVIYYYNKYEPIDVTADEKEE
ncbi:hypothetical protein RM553_08505 [Zunongwangia sp. F363]|uniref:Lipocalin-like domain-containing protein n=1 Tax=Autumnicola tepida TaxID=3075595 RepID=A0ABU3C981_9FLAO|nr:hypothetical protein [Zunongwangia sp. F363]MDT0642869.1 hypothetical protein [Zunongwangia sp. F363]